VPEPGTWLDREDFSPLKLQMLETGSQRTFKKPWADLVTDFRRIGKTPSAHFVFVILVAGALALLKQDAPAA
jgi:hypothetical protein